MNTKANHLNRKNENNLSFDHIRIRKIREARKLSQKMVAAQLGISQSSYNDIEQGKTKLRVDNLSILAHLLHVDIRCFFEAEISYDCQLSTIEEMTLLKREYQKLKQENERLNQLLQDQKNLYFHYEQKSEKLLTNAHLQIRKKRFYINILLLASLLLMIICGFVLYFEELYILFMQNIY